MRIFTFFIVVLFAFSCTDKKAADLPINQETDLADFVSAINDVYVDIYTTNGMEVVSADIFESVEGGTIEGYFDYGDLKRVLVTLYTANGQMIEDYYYHEGELIFVLEEEITFIQDQVSAEIIDASILKATYYFNKGEMIYWKGFDNNEIDPESDDFKEAATSWMQLAEVRKNALSEQSS